MHQNEAAVVEFRIMRRQAADFAHSKSPRVSDLFWTFKIQDPRGTG
jgi:hypothetical protein